MARRSGRRGKIQHVEAALERAHRLARGRDAGQHRQAGILGGVEQAVSEAGRDAEPGPGGDRGAHVLRREQRPGADDRIGDRLGHRPDGVESGRRAQCDLEHPQSAAGQRPRQWRGVGGLLDGEHRDNWAEPADRVGVHPSSSLMRATSPAVDWSSPASAPSSPRMTGARRCASALPSSTPNWSKELMSHMAPIVNTLCS